MRLQTLAFLALTAAALLLNACNDAGVAATTDATSSGATSSGATSSNALSSSSSVAGHASSSSVATSSTVHSSSSVASVNTGTTNTNAKIAADIAGYWIQTVGFSGVANRDTAIFVNDTIHIDKTTMHNQNGGSLIYANTGKIGSTGEYGMVDYEYVISGDTLYAESQSLTGTPDGIVNKALAIQYVRKSQYKESAVSVDPVMIGAWKEVKKPTSVFEAGNKTLTITTTVATYNNGYKDIVYGTGTTLYVRAGEIGESAGGVNTKKMGYALALDTVWINDYGDQKRGLGTPFTK